MQLSPSIAGGRDSSLTVLAQRFLVQLDTLREKYPDDVDDLLEEVIDISVDALIATCRAQVASSTT